MKNAFDVEHVMSAIILTNRFVSFNIPVMLREHLELR